MRLVAQQAQGIAVHLLSAQEAAQRLPICRFDDAALIGFEPDAGFADAYLVATGFARAARRRGVKIVEGVEVSGLVRERGRVVGVETSQGRFASATVVSAQNIWARDIERWTGIETPVRAERHGVLALAGPAPYTFAMPVYKDLGSPGMLYCRSYGGTQMLVSEGGAGETLAEPDNEQGDIPVDDVLRRRRAGRRALPFVRGSRPGLVVDRRLRRHAGLESGARPRCPTFPVSSSPTDSPGTASSSRRPSAACWRRRRSACRPTSRWRPTHTSGSAAAGYCAAATAPAPSPEVRTEEVAGDAAARRHRLERRRRSPCTAP